MDLGWGCSPFRGRGVCESVTMRRVGAMKRCNFLFYCLLLFLSPEEMAETLYTHPPWPRFIVKLFMWCWILIYVLFHSLLICVFSLYYICYLVKSWKYHVELLFWYYPLRPKPWFPRGFLQGNHGYREDDSSWVGGLVSYRCWPDFNLPFYFQAFEKNIKMKKIYVKFVTAMVLQLRSQVQVAGKLWLTSFN